MSELDDIKRKNMEQLHQMSTEDLEELLNTKSQSSENTDMEDIFSILEVIEKRERLAPSGKYTDTDTAWDSFNKNYRPFSKEAKSIYDLAEEIEDISICQSTINEPKAKYAVRRGKWPIRHKALLRTACIIAIISIILLSSTIVASALGYDLWNLVARWTRDTFGFSSTSSYEQESPVIQIPDDTNMYNNLQEALDNYNITTKLTPSWLPDGYILYDISVNETPMQTTIHAIYKQVESEIVIIITSFNKPSNRIYEKDGENVTVYSLNDTEHYIMSNLDQTSIAWHTDNYECSVSGAFSIDEAKNIINSIYERDSK